MIAMHLIHLRCKGAKVWTCAFLQLVLCYRIHYVNTKEVVGGASPQPFCYKKDLMQSLPLPLHRRCISITVHLQ